MSLLTAAVGHSETPVRLNVPSVFREQRGFKDQGSIRREKQGFERDLKSPRCKNDICVRMSYGVRNVVCEKEI